MVGRKKSHEIFAKYALPQMAGLLLNSVYLIVDGIFIGNRLGRDAMAAAAISVPLVEALIAVALLVSSGAGIIISNSLGRGEAKEANRVFNMSVVILAVISLIVAVFGNIFIGRCAVLLGATPEIHGEAVTYLRYIVSFSAFLLFSFLLSGLVRNDNRPKLAMAALAVGSVSNIILDYVFMYPLNMGIAGAALATALGPIFSVAILLPHFLRKKGFLYFARFKKAAGDTRRIFTLGFPAFIMEFSIGIVTFIYNYTIVKYGYGELGLAAYLILGYIALIILTLFLGIGQGLQPVFSYCNGSGEAAGSRDLLSFSKKMVLLIGVAVYVCVLFFSRRFVSVFAPGDPVLVDFTSRKAAIYFWGFFFAGYNILMISFWQAVEEARRALAISLLRSVLILPALIAALPIIWSSEAIWVCHSLAEAASASVAAGMSFASKKPTAGERRGTALPAR